MPKHLIILNLENLINIPMQNDNLIFITLLVFTIFLST